MSADHDVLLHAGSQMRLQEHAGPEHLSGHDVGVYTTDIGICLAECPGEP